MARIFGFAVAAALLAATLWMVHWAFTHRPLASSERSVQYRAQLFSRRTGLPPAPPLSTPLTGRRMIKTGTGGAAIVFVPLLLTSAVLFYQSVSDRQVRGSPLFLHG
jgi:hypothetical protein